MKTFHLYPIPLSNIGILKIYLKYSKWHGPLSFVLLPNVKLNSNDRK